MIDGYLRSESELEDHAIHLLFSANRWELAFVAHVTANSDPDPLSGSLPIDRLFKHTSRRGRPSSPIGMPSRALRSQLKKVPV